MLGVGTCWTTGTQSKRQHRRRVAESASIADSRGRYPYESGWNCGSTMGPDWVRLQNSWCRGVNVQSLVGPVVGTKDAGPRRHNTKKGGPIDPPIVISNSVES